MILIVPVFNTVKISGAKNMIYECKKTYSP
jgi:hypothetical protein